MRSSVWERTRSEGWRHESEVVAVGKTRHVWVRQASFRIARTVVGFRGRWRKWWPTSSALTSNNENAVSERRFRHGSALPVVRVLAPVLGLMLAGCPTGAELDTAYAEYEPVPDGIGASTVTSSTTSPPVGSCDDTNVDDVAMNEWCGTSACHGDGAAPGDAPLWLFSPTRSTDLLNLPAVTTGCGAERIIDTANPEASLIITAIRNTSPCGVEMPDSFPINVPEQQACIEAWVLGLAAAGGGG